MDKLKIAHIVFSLNTGGLEKLVVELARRVDSGGFGTSVYCLTGEGTLSKELTGRGFKVFYFNKKGGVDLFLPFRIARLLKREGIDIVHTHDSSANLYGSIAGKLAGAKVIINTEHGGIYFETRRKRLINRILCLLNDREICVSNNVKDDLRGMHLCDERLVVIHNGIDFGRFDSSTELRVDIQIEKDKIRKELGIKESNFVITTVGRLSKEKNQKMILDAAGPVLANIPQAKFIITGDGPSRKDLEEYAVTLKIAESVIFLGERDDIPQVLKMSDCFVLSSNYESFGLTILEAMAAGVPVIATDAGGVKEIVKDGETGALIAKGDSAALAGAVIRIKSDPVYAGKIVVRAKEMVRDNYRIEAMVKEHEDLYLSCYGREPVRYPALRPMRVLAFGIDDRALLDIDGHSKRWNSRMGRYVERLDVIVEVKKKTDITEKHIAGNVRILPIHVPHPALYPFIAYRRALAEHKKHRYNLATTEEPFRTGFAGWLFKRKTLTALSVEYHNDNFYNRDWLKERPIRHGIYTVLGKLVVRGADSIRCVCGKNLLELRRICKNDPGKLIEIIPTPAGFYNPEKNDAGAEEIRKNLLNDKGGLLILFVGRLVLIKKVDELIKVFCEVRKKHSHVYLAIVGDGPESERLKRNAVNCEKGGIFFKGYAQEEEIFNWYGASDIFVNPAHIEPYGRVYIEAMSAGKPVITTSGAGAVEDRLCVDGVNSLVVKPGRLDELEKAMVRLIEDETLRRRLGKNGLVAVREKFNYENALGKMKGFWERTLRAQEHKSTRDK